MSNGNAVSNENTISNKIGDFTELDDASFEQNLKDVPVALIDYYASWCGSCRIAAPIFKRVAKEYQLPLYKIDAEKNPDSRKLITIDNLPTIALWKDGKIVDSLCTTKEEGLKEFLKGHGYGH